MSSRILNPRNYKLYPDITEGQLSKVGFRRNQFSRYIYKDMVQFIMEIDLESETWDYQVYDTDKDAPYSPYYNREFGVNTVILKIEKKIQKIIRKMQREKILMSKRRI